MCRDLARTGKHRVFKDAIDWLSRPVSDIPQVFGNRPVGVIGAWPGRFGTILAQDGWPSVLRTLRMCPWFGARAWCRMPTKSSTNQANWWTRLCADNCAITYAASLGSFRRASRFLSVVARGSVKKNLVPFPNSLSAHMVPP
jgi:hypothetical protein